MAGIGAEWTLVAILTWDLASSDKYTVEQREELTRPWAAVVRCHH